jgi:hypothetical protein
MLSAAMSTAHAGNTWGVNVVVKDRAGAEVALSNAV